MAEIKFKLRKGDQVIVIAGNDKGKQGTIVRHFDQRRIASSLKAKRLNKIKKHQKPTQVSPDGGIVSMEKPIHASNVMLVRPARRRSRRASDTRRVTKRAEEARCYEKSSGTQKNPAKPLE
ncbi:MAG: 50S ribosomal protein L24 [Bacillus subtilis]|nr:50S ribosomal protein L24 [Bacillus subtilis]